VVHSKERSQARNSEERPINHSNSEMKKDNKANGMPTYFREWRTHDTYITIVYPPPFPPPTAIMLGLLKATTLSISLRFHIAPPAFIRVGMPLEVKMPGIS
jgi:hypothetical protein